MLTANYLAKIANQATRLSEDLHDEIIYMVVDRITQRLGMNADYILTSTDKWQLQVLNDAGYLMSDIQKEIAKKTKLQLKVIKKAFEDAGIEQIKYDDQVYKSAGIAVTDISQSPNILRLLQASYERSYGTWYNLTQTTARSAYNVFINECSRAYNLVASGTKTLSQAFVEAVDVISTQGLYIDYPTGHRDTIETATARVIRTGVAQACGQITAQRALENGVTLFLTSAHNGARPEHQLWQGKVFWVDWAELSKRIGISGKGAEATAEEKSKYDEFCSATDIGTVTGLEGANCRHSYGAFFEGMENPYDGMTFDDTYEIEQGARALENRIRHTKRDIKDYEIARKGTESEDAKAQLTKMLSRKEKTLERQMKQYYEYCKENNIKPQEMRLHIA